MTVSRWVSAEVCPGLRPGDRLMLPGGRLYRVDAYDMQQNAYAVTYLGGDGRIEITTAEVMEGVGDDRSWELDLDEDMAYAVACTERADIHMAELMGCVGEQLARMQAAIADVAPAVARNFEACARSAREIGGAAGAALERRMSSADAASPDTSKPYFLDLIGRIDAVTGDIASRRP